MPSIPPEDDPFEEFRRKWRELKSRVPGSRGAREFLDDLTATPSGRKEGPEGSWLHACRKLAAGQAPEPAAWHDEMWADVAAAMQRGGAHGGNDPRESARILLACARALRAAGENEPPESTWRELATPHFPLRTVQDVAAELRAHGRGAAAAGGRRLVQLPAVFASGEAGLSATLELELLDAGRGEFCPAVEMALVAWDGDFARALVEVRAFLEARGLWPGLYDVRWKLTFLDEERRPLQGGSLGAALAFGTAWLGALHGLLPPWPIVERLRAVHHPLSLCFSSTLAPAGALDGQPVSGVAQKIQAAVRDERVSILLFPSSVVAQIPTHHETHFSTQSSTVFTRPRTGTKAPSLTILCAAQLFTEDATPAPDALGAILLETAMPEEFDWRSPHEKLVPRPWLADFIEGFTRSPQGSGVFLLTGASGSGKTCLFREQLAALCDAHPVAHFITAEQSQWDNPAAIFGSLAAQLRRKHRLGPPATPGKGWHSDHALRAAQQLLAVLREVSPRLPAAGAPEVLWIDALNAAYGEGAPYFSAAGALHELIEAAELRAGEKLELPPGIYLVVTSSDGPHLDHLRPHCRAKVNLDNKADQLAQWEIEADIDRFLRAENLPREQRMAAIHAVQGNFLFARFWVDFVARSDPAQRSATLDELLDLVILRTAGIWRTHARGSLEAAALEVLDNFGLLACSREPLSYFLLTALFDPVRGERLDKLCRMAEQTRLFRLTDAPGTGDRQIRFFHSYVVEFLLMADEKLPAGSMLHRLRAQLRAPLLAAGRPRGDELLVRWHTELAEACHRGVEALFAARAAGTAAPDARLTAYAVRHLCSHLRLAEDWDRLAARLTDGRFLLAKVGASRGGIFDLLHTLQSALRGSPKMPDDHERRAAVNAVLQALRPHASAIAEEPFLALQLIHNETPARGSVPLPVPAIPDAEKPLELRDQDWFAALCKAMDAERRAWLATRHPAAQAGHRPRGVIRHRNSVLALAFAADPVPGSKRILLASVGADHRLRVWEENGLPSMRIKLHEQPSAETAPESATMRRGMMRFPPTGLAFVHGRKRIATATVDGILVLDPWAEDLAAQDLTESLCTTAGRAHSLASSPDLEHPLLLVGGKDGRARVVDLLLRRVVAPSLVPEAEEPPKDGPHKTPASKKPAAEETPQTDSYCCVALSPDGTLAAVAHPDQTISIWKLFVGEYVEALERRKAVLRARVRGTLDAGLKVVEPWTMLRAECLHHLPAPADRRVDALAFSPCGKMLAVGGGFRRGIVELWRLDRGDCLCFSAHLNAVWALAFSRDPTSTSENDLLLITGSFDRSAAVWKLGNIAVAEARAQGRLRSRPLDGAPGRKHVSYTIRELSEPLVPTARMVHRDVVMAVAVSPDHVWLATGGVDDAVQLWEIKELLQQAPAVADVGARPHPGCLHTGVFDPQGRWLATGGDDGNVQLWDVDRGKATEPYSLGHAIRALRFSADGQRLAVGTTGSSALCHLDGAGRIIARDAAEAAYAIFAVAFDPEAAGPVYLRGDHAGQLCRVGGGPALPAAHRHTAAVRSLGISPRGRWLVSVGDDSMLLVTDLTAANAAPHQPSRKHTGRIKSHAFSRCGRWLATGGQENIRIWDTDAWTVVATLAGHRDEIWALDFSPDGLFLASGSRDGTARVWDLATGQALCCLPCANAVLAVQFGPDSLALRVADAGSGGGIPSIHLATLCGVGGK